MHRRQSLIHLAAAVTALAPVSRPHAAAPARLIVPFPAGSAPDLIGRDLAHRLAAPLGENLIVDNRPGGGGVLGVTELRRAAADGRTLALLGSSTLCIVPTLRRPAPFNPETALSPIGRFMTSPFGILVPAASPWATLADVVASARREPGRINVGHAGVGGLGHLLIEDFSHRAGIRLNPVPFDSATLTAATLRAEVPLTVEGLGLAAPHVRAGKLRLLALAAPSRVAAWPETPTLAELGHAGVDKGFWWGLAGPAGLPAPVIARLHGALAQVLADTGFTAQREAIGSVFRLSSAEQMAQDIRTESAHWAAVAARADIRLD